MAQYSDWEDQGYDRQLKLAEALRAKGLNTTGEMRGRIYVPKNPWVNFAEGAVGGILDQNAQEGQRNLQGRRDTEFNALIANRPSANKTVQTPNFVMAADEAGNVPPVTETVPKSFDEYNADVETFGAKLLGSRDSRAQAVAGQILTRSLEHPYKQMEREQNQQQLTEAFRKYQEQNAPVASPAPIAAPGLAPPLMPTGQDKPWQPSDIAPGSKVAPQDADRAAIIQNELNNPANQANPEAWAALVKEGASLGLAPQAPTAAPAAAPAAAKKPALPLSTHMYLTGGPEGQKLAAFLAPGERQEGKQNFTINNIQPFQAGQQTQRIAATSAENDKKIAAKGAGAAPMTTEQLVSGGAQVASGQPINQVVPGYGAAAAANKAAVRQEAINQIKAANPGMTDQQAGAELAARTIGFKADTMSVGQLVKMEGATKPIVQQLNYNVDETTRLLKKFQGRDISPVINAVADQVKIWTGDPDFAPLWFHMNGAAIEAAKLRSGGQASVAQLSVEAMKEAKSWADAHMTPETWDKIGSAMKGEGEAKLRMYQDTADEMKRRGGGSTGGKSPTALPQSKEAVGETKMYRDKTYRLKPGMPRNQQSSWEVVSG